MHPMLEKKIDTFDFNHGLPFLRSDDTSKQDIIRMDDILDSFTNCP
jgi:hypothetical protein